MEERILTIDRLAFGGEGVGRDEGKVVFVPWTVPGDRVRVRTLSDHGRYERAELLEVLEKSADRADPPCPVFGLCGGCQWQHLKYETQLRWKTEILRESLERTGQVSAAKILPMIPAPNPWNYRRRVQMKVDADGRIGFYRFKSHEVVPVEMCSIADPLLNDKLKEIRSSPERLERGFEISLNGSSPASLREDIEGDERSFSQINPGQNKSLIQTVLDFAFGNAERAFTRKKTVVELYAGSGNLTFPLAERAGEVIAVEENPDAVRQGEDDAMGRGIETIDWIRGTAEWGLKKIYRRKISADVLVLDPPRRGAKEILDLIPLVRPRLIVYVSCDPMTLSRDVKDLTRRHYSLEKVQPIDMFPQTYHIESVAQLSLV